MPTIREIAKRAGVSIATVSNVITGAVPVSPALRERVEQAIVELDYHPNDIARSLKMNRTRLLGMVISDITNPFFPQLVRGAEDVAVENDYLLITFNSDDRVERERKIFSVLRSRRVDGVLLVVAPDQGDSSHLGNLLRSGIPIVCLDRLPAGFEVDSVSVDNRAAAKECVEHLFSVGRRRVAIITGPPTLQTARERLEGYRLGLARAGVPYDEQLVLEGDFRADSGYELGRRALSLSERPDALFVSNNTMAMGVLRAVEDLKLRCPEDVAIALFDDLPFLYAFRPHLTAVSQPAYAIGKKGVELLLDRIEGRVTKTGPIHVTLKTELIIRESTAGRA